MATRKTFFYVTSDKLRSCLRLFKRVLTPILWRVSVTSFTLCVISTWVPISKSPDYMWTTVPKNACLLLSRKGALGITKIPQVVVLEFHLFHRTRKPDWSFLH